MDISLLNIGKILMNDPVTVERELGGIRNKKYFEIFLLEFLKT